MFYFLGIFFRVFRIFDTKNSETFFHKFNDGRGDMEYES